VLRLCVVGGERLLRETEALGRSVRVIKDVRSAEDLRNDAAVMQADAIIVDGDADDPLGQGELLARRFPEAPVLLASHDTGIDLYRRASRKGFKGLLRRPLEARELEDVLDEVGGTYYGEDSSDQARGWYMPGFSQEPQEGRRRPGRVFRQQVITVYSPKGGVGKTTVAVNLAAIYAKYVPEARVVVLDFDSHARVISLLQMNTPLSVESWQETSGEGFEERLALYPVGRQGGIYVLPGVRRAINKDLLGEALVTDVLTYMRRNADAVIVDCGPDFEDATVVSLEYATTVLVIATIDVQTLRDINKFARDLVLTRADDRKVRVVVNRVPKRSSFSVKQVRGWLPWEVIGQIPEDESVPLIQNQGRIPVLIKKTPFVQSLMRVASKITPALEDAVSEKKSGLFGFLARFRRRKGGEI